MLQEFTESQSVRGWHSDLDGLLTLLRDLKKHRYHIVTKSFFLSEWLQGHL